MGRKNNKELRNWDYRHNNGRLWTNPRGKLRIDSEGHLYRDRFLQVPFVLRPNETLGHAIPKGGIHAVFGGTRHAS
jgi:hypothetical protein